MKTNEKAGFFLCLLLLLAIQLVILKNINVVEDPVEFNVSVENGMVLEFEATGYAIGPPYNSITKSGHPVVNLGYLKIGDENIFTVAADKNVLPMGSLIYIDSLGIGMVQDTGTAIKGMKIDICFTTMDKAMQFGKKKVRVMVLRRSFDE